MPRLLNFSSGFFERINLFPISNHAKKIWTLISSWTSFKYLCFLLDLSLLFLFESVGFSWFVASAFFRVCGFFLDLLLLFFPESVGFSWCVASAFFRVCGVFFRFFPRTYSLCPSVRNFRSMQFEVLVLVLVRSSSSCCCVYAVCMLYLPLAF